jgi:catechol 2,3-dioxygenase-like lactoylglutathione lyase family enzyme
MIISVVGITLWTDDLDRMLRFYRDVLLLPLHSFHEDEGFAAFELGDIRFNVGRHGSVSGESKDPLRVMPHLGVDDIRAEHERLAAVGVPFIRVPEQEHWGGWVATFQDPDGNVLQLLQFPD